MRAIGLMSGTSLDGVDAALVDIVPQAQRYAARVDRFTTIPFEGALRERLAAALPPHACPPAVAVDLDAELGALFAAAALQVAAGERVDFAASHGLTLFHAGEASRTLQIGDPYRVRDALQASVVFDFRRADCALGGHGAPLVPHVDALLLASNDVDVVALNLGGIANVTVLPRGAPAAAATAWDTGPANMLVDAFVLRRTNGTHRCDVDGAQAARGTVDARALHELVAREAFYLMQPPPKSTGRERFGVQLLDAHEALFAGLSLEDGCATLCAFSATTIAQSLSSYGPSRARVIASGGGTHNATLMRMLGAELAQNGSELVRSDAFGIDCDAKEALAFALLGYETLRGRPANVPRATGAVRAGVLGAIAPHELGALLEKMRVECASKPPDAAEPPA